MCINLEIAKADGTKEGINIKITIIVRDLNFHLSLINKISRQVDDNC